MKQAILVLGPESSGTRLVTQLLLEVGYHGDPDHVQRFDTQLPSDLTPIVWRRSVPHFEHREWPTIRDMAGALRERGYEVKAVVTTRDWFPMIQSQVRSLHTRNTQESWDNLQRAYPHIFEELAAAAVQFVVVSYEALVQRPEASAQKLFAMLGISRQPRTRKVRDENAKWYTEPGQEEQRKRWWSMRRSQGQR